MMISMMAEMKFHFHQMTHAHLFEIGNRCHQEGTIGVLAGQLGL